MRKQAEQQQSVYRSTLQASCEAPRLSLFFLLLPLPLSHFLIPKRSVFTAAARCSWAFPEEFVELSLTLLLIMKAKQKRLLWGNRFSHSCLCFAAYCFAFCRILGPPGSALLNSANPIFMNTYLGCSSRHVNFIKWFLTETRSQRTIENKSKIKNKKFKSNEIVLSCCFF